MMSFIHLPEYLHLDVLSFLETCDQREVLRVNTEFLGLWSKVRTIKLTRLQFLTYSRSYQLELLSMVHNPYQQLDLELKTLDALNDYRGSIIAASEIEDNKLYTELQLFDLVLNTWAFSSLHILQVELNNVISILERTCLKKVHTLDLYGSNEDSSGLLEQVFELIAKNNNYEGMQLNSLIISFCVRHYTTVPEVEVRCLPAIQNLQKLKFNQRVVFHDLKWLDDFKALKYVGFISSDFRCDITCLNRVQYLELRRCTGLTDISSLNNNLRIAIDECVGISDYSKCFKISEGIWLGITGNVKVISLGDYPIVKRVSLLGDGLVHYEIPKTHMNAQLRYLYLFEFQCDKVISFPPNNLQRLTIACSNTITNIEGIENIPDIGLHALDNLVSIGKVDVGNKKIKIRHCKEINVTSCLRYCETIFIEGSVKIDKPFDVPQLKRLTVLYCPDFIQMLSLGDQGDRRGFQELQSFRFAGSRDEWSGIVFSKLQELMVSESLLWKNKDTPHFELHPLDPSQFPSLMKIVVVKRTKKSRGFTPMGNFQEKQRYENSSTFLKLLTQPIGLSQACREELKRIRNELERTLQFVYNHEAVSKEYGFNEENIRAFESVLKVMKEKGQRQSVIENIKQFSSEPL